MDESVTLRTPLKEINNTPSSEKQFPVVKRRKINVMSYDLATQNTGHFEMGDSFNKTEMLKECPVNRIKESPTFTQPLSVNCSEPAKYVMLKVNKFFMADLRCPEFSPFSLIKYSCSSASNCKHESHKINSKQISETQEKALTFLAKSWYMLKYPLTCIVKENTHLSPFVMRFLFYGILDEKDENVCLRIRDIIKGHLKTHPPCNKKLRNLYYNTLVGDVDNVALFCLSDGSVVQRISENDLMGGIMKKTIKDPSNPEIMTYNFNTILASIEKTLNELNNQSKIVMKAKNLDESTNSFEIPRNVDEFFQFFSDNYMKTGNILPSTLISSNRDFEEDKDKINSEGLLQRLFLVFSLMVDILEENFRMWWMRSRYYLRKKLHSKHSFPIIAKVAWERSEDRGSVNDHCMKVFDLLISCPQLYKPEISRYITLLSEVVRASEENKLRKFPFFGDRCDSFAKELSAHIKAGNTTEQETVSLVQLINPPWLKFKVCGFILKSELTSGGIDDLNSILKIMQRNLSLRSTAVLNKEAEQIKIISSPPTSKKIKADSSGETLIHKWCRGNNTKALSRLLRSKGVDVNIVDNAGWTPLHNVAMYNSIDCLKLLIKHRLNSSRGAEKLNIFALNNDNDSPLTCAVTEGHEEVVKILLNNGAGVSVWNQASKGISAVELAKTKGGLQDLLISGWTKSVSSYRNLNMTLAEIDLLYLMLSSYCNVYHIREHCKELDPDYCKHDSYYEFDYFQFCKDESTLITFYELVEKLCTCRSNPKNLKNMLFYLKCRLN